jgi:hypothetical protein
LDCLCLDGQHQHRTRRLNKNRRYQLVISGKLEYKTNMYCISCHPSQVVDSPDMAGLSVSGIKKSGTSFRAKTINNTENKRLNTKTPMNKKQPIQHQPRHRRPLPLEEEDCSLCRSRPSRSLPPLPSSVNSSFNSPSASAADCCSEMEDKGNRSSGIAVSWIELYLWTISGCLNSMHLSQLTNQGNGRCRCPGTGKRKAANDTRWLIN